MNWQKNTCSVTRVLPHVQKIVIFPILDLSTLPERLRTTSWEGVASTSIGLVGQVTHKKAALSAMFQVLFQNLALLKYFDLNQFDGKKTVIFLLVEAKS